ncbi:hypothetical protein SERLA73DRAFT_190953 [Serpula lacrymans var. lacrymans S7.3]|uniref:Uncharacterized protein n=2 Tax=Serpula lacrymans var. lacrymans TaxID=341189 RepID=F8QGP1_SERL3|nr:uncharacterized protein SERLADRAFT_456948 [Serpula lacrymans var. lacrymans S7.9]EGN92587.1 hypothetical protein SERLA73DRAFT_190953 [Serpula lacrymans var. lacrymans S7.3]EGO29333.1 hypothetical protein SERLADRAFT_456948 [Serpula lacrymans var. lacrymans S7.9]
MSQLLTIVSLLLSASTAVVSTPCVAFDINWNLLAFGLDGKDYNAGTQDTWAGNNNKATDITGSGRPSFDGANTTCYLSQYTNAIYVLNGDSQNPSSIYIYDATANSWTTQATTTNGFNPAAFDAILDHDTNVFYALSGGNLFSLDMGLLKAANSTPLAWTNDKAAPYPADYEPVMALAENHVHFLDVPGVAAGSADIFVIHYSYFQPQPQPYPLTNGSTLPATYGQATSFFQNTGVQQEFAFIPEDSSAVYVINVDSNNTQVLAGPTIKDPKATYFASVDTLVQLSSNGAVSYLPYQQGNTAANTAASWATVSVLATVAPPSSPSNSSNGPLNGTSGGSSGNSSSTGSGSSGKSSDAPSSRVIHASVLAALAMGALALVL